MGLIVLLAEAVHGNDRLDVAVTDHKVQAVGVKAAGMEVTGRTVEQVIHPLLRDDSRKGHLQVDVRVVFPELLEVISPLRVLGHQVLHVPVFRLHPAVRIQRPLNWKLKWCTDCTGQCRGCGG